MRVVTFKIQEDLLSRLNRAAETLGFSRSELIRMAIVEWLRNHEEEIAKKQYNVRFKVVRI